MPSNDSSSSSFSHQFITFFFISKMAAVAAAFRITAPALNSMANANAAAAQLVTLLSALINHYSTKSSVTIIIITIMAAPMMEQTGARTTRRDAKFLFYFFIFLFRPSVE